MEGVDLEDPLKEIGPGDVMPPDRLLFFHGCGFSCSNLSNGIFVRSGGDDLDRRFE